MGKNSMTYFMDGPQCVTEGGNDFRGKIIGGRGCQSWSKIYRVTYFTWRRRFDYKIFGFGLNVEALVLEF